jgi:hypothetical protein
MRKQMTFLGHIILGCTILFTLTQCSKELNANASNLKLTTSVHPDLLPGSCPYPCTDIRCKGYENGYCGTGTSTDTVAVVKNTANPEDSVGNRHNTALNAIMPNYTGGIEPTLANSWSYTISFLSSYHYSTTLLNAVEDTMVNRYDTAIYSMTADSYSSYAYSHGQISNKVYTYLNSLGNLIGALPSVPLSTTYSGFASSVISLESTILHDSTMTSTDRIIILSATSVARYSACYWINYYNAQTSAASIAVIKPAVAPPAKSWFSWSTVAGGDVVGAVAGALGGAAVGVLAGGVGAGPGAVAGGVSMGISSSAYEAGMQVWHHFFN